MPKYQIFAARDPITAIETFSVAGTPFAGLTREQMLLLFAPSFKKWERRNRSTLRADDLLKHVQPGDKRRDLQDIAFGIFGVDDPHAVDAFCRCPTKGQWKAAGLPEWRRQKLNTEAEVIRFRLGVFQPLAKAQQESWAQPNIRKLADQFLAGVDNALYGGRLRAALRTPAIIWSVKAPCVASVGSGATRCHRNGEYSIVLNPTFVFDGYTLMNALAHEIAHVAADQLDGYWGDEHDQGHGAPWKKRKRKIEKEFSSVKITERLPEKY